MAHHDASTTPMDRGPESQAAAAESVAGQIQGQGDTISGLAFFLRSAIEQEKVVAAMVALAVAAAAFATTPLQEKPHNEKSHKKLGNWLNY